MSFKKVTKEEWLALGLPESTMIISPFYEYDRKKKEFKKPILMVTSQRPSKKKK